MKHYYGFKKSSRTSKSQCQLEKFERTSIPSKLFIATRCGDNRLLGFGGRVGIQWINGSVNISKLFRFPSFFSKCNSTSGNRRG